MIAIEQPATTHSSSAFMGPLRDEHFDLTHQAEIMHLVQLDQLEAARSLAQKTAEQCPNDEISWVMLSLVCEVQQDWCAARKALERLRDLQGHNIPASVQLHYIRVLHCLGEDMIAKAVLQAAMTRWPDDQMLRQEQQIALHRAQPRVARAG